MTSFGAPGSAAAWKVFRAKHQPSVDEQVRLRDAGIKDQILRGETGAIERALAMIVKLRSPFIEPDSRERAFGSRVQNRTLQTLSGSPAERGHADLISKRIAIFADSEPAVREFRIRQFGSHEALSEERARAVLRSPLLDHATTQDLEGWGIPVVRHDSTIVSQASHGRTHKIEILASWAGGKRTLTFGWPLPDSDPLHLEYPSEQGGRRSVLVRLASILDDLRRTSEALAIRAPYNALWQSGPGAEPACAWLLLTGIALPLAPIVVTHEVPGTVDSITIRALTQVVSPQSVMAAFAEAQARIRGRRKGRRFAERSLALVLFIDKKAQDLVETNQTRLAQSLWKAWNEEYAEKPGWPFANRQDMVRAYQRAKLAYFPDPTGVYEQAALIIVEREIKERIGEG